MSADPDCSTTSRIAVVDDEEQVLKVVSAVLRSGGFENTVCLNDGRDVEKLLRSDEIGILLLDLSMPHISGRQLLETISSEYPGVITIVITGNSDIDSAVQCMKCGAYDYLVKPIEKSKLIATVRRAVEMQELRRENRTLKTRLFASELSNPEAFKEIVAVSDKMKSVFLYVEAVAPSFQPVLITGETGVGKELIAQSIHTLSGRDGKLVSVNVAGFDDNMLSDTLFGHQKGAFTGAIGVRRGLVETATGGTLFLDEIGDLSLVSQVKLLRLLDAREYFQLGSDSPKRSEARIVVATNRDLEEAVLNGSFRKDLYYRLHTHHIEIPPLRQRFEDLPYLLNHFLRMACDELGVPVPRSPYELLAYLCTKYFPGNIRELRSLVFDAVTRLKSAGPMPKSFPLEVFQRQLAGGLPESAEANEQSGAVNRNDILQFAGRLPTIKDATDLLVKEAMRRSNGKQTVASQMLGISQQALSKRLKKTEQESESDELDL